MLQRLFVIIALVTVSFCADAQGIKTPQPSPTQMIRQDFGIGSVELSYSRPGLKGRKLYTDLAPTGKVWRTGANQATTLNFSDTVIIGGTTVPAGKYGLVSIPTKDQWTLILTKQLDVTNPAAYKQENDVVRVMAKPMQLKESVETFTMQFSNVKSTTMDLDLMWGDVALKLPITVDFDKKVLAQINSSLRDSRPYYQAAMYYMETGKDLNQAVAWLNMAIEQNPKAYWVYHQKANALARLGKKAEARTAAQTSLDLAKAEPNEDYVRLNEKLLESLK